MLKVENVAVYGIEEAIRGMRNPMNSWSKSDTTKDLYCREFQFIYDHPVIHIGPNDLELMLKLAKAGSVHAKYRRMITVYMDITAPLYWWKEFDTYKIGTVANSCSTMHKIQAKEFVLDDFSHEHLLDDGKDCVIEESEDTIKVLTPLNVLEINILMLNKARKLFLKTGDKRYWWQMIQLLGTNFNQKRTIMFNYEVLSNMYPNRKEHKLDEWRYLCEVIDSLPYSELITCTREVH